MSLMPLPSADVSTEGAPALASVPREGRDVLALHELNKCWGDLRVLDSVELVLAAGTITSIGGTNGVGKTTLLRLAAGLIGPDSGVIWLDGLHPERDRREYLRRVGLMAAGDRGLYARLSVRQHLDFAARVAFVPRRERGVRVDAALDRFLLGDLAGRRVERMSMGQRQRLRLAMTLMHGPDVLLLDEPANSLDEPGLEILRAAVVEIVNAGGVALWCSPGGLEQPVAFDARYTLENGKLLETV